MRFGKVAAAAKAGDPGSFEVVKRFEKSCTAIVAGMIVGHGQRVEAALEHGEDTRVGAEVVDLAGHRLARRIGGDRAFEVADAIVRIGQERSERRERIAARSHQPSRPVVEHDVADEDQAYRFRPCRLDTEQPQGKKKDATRTRI